MSKKQTEVLGINAHQRRGLRHLFIAICRKRGVEFKSSASRKDWEQVKRTLVWNDDYLRGRLFRPGKTQKNFLHF